MAGGTQISLFDADADDRDPIDQTGYGVEFIGSPPGTPGRAFQGATG